MTDEFEFAFCVCGHPKLFHSGPKFDPVYPHKDNWLCRGNGPGIKCRCKAFHRAIGQAMSYEESVKNTRRP